MFDADEKIYVVVLVIAIIILGIGFLLFYLERRLGNAEREIQKLKREANPASDK